MNGLYREDVHVCYPMFNISQAKYRRYEIMAIKTRHTQRILRICYFVIFLYFIWSTLNTNDWLSVYGTHMPDCCFFLFKKEKGVFYWHVEEKKFKHLINIQCDSLPSLY